MNPELEKAHELLVQSILREPLQRNGTWPFLSPSLANAQSLLCLPIVNGIGISENTRGEETLEIFTTVAVELKLEDLRNQFSLGSFPINVTYTGPNIPCQRPAMGGHSISYTNHQWTGTFGCEVRDGSNRKFILSCNHVLADSADSSSPSPVGGSIWQPGASDGGAAADKIGLLHSFCALDFSGAPNYMDAALSKPDSSSDMESGIYKLGSIKGKNPTPNFNITVRKYGWTTKTTVGKLKITKLSMLISYKKSTALFEDQYGIIGITKGNFALRGDSGAIVIDDKDLAVALLFAIASGIDLAYASPIEPILTRFKVSL
jgi:hypothetical protein